METTHHIFCRDARGLTELPANSVELVVTSPPYPMIEMWDDLFTALNPEIGSLLTAAADGDAAAATTAYELMHAELAAVWEELSRVLVDGGIACINIGAATRSLGGQFQLYANPATITDYFHEYGFHQLPGIIWRKPTNSAAKFMGSGMRPPNAYVTLERERILVFRNGERRTEIQPAERDASAYFWEERNTWFSDVWTDVRGISQAFPEAAETMRDRSAAYPVTIPFRLINMFSVYGDVVLDPFWGTGTTTIAAMAAGRHSYGYERDTGFVTAFTDHVSAIPEFATDLQEARLTRHVEFTQTTDRECAYTATTYDLPVVTQQETALQLYTVSQVTEVPSDSLSLQDVTEPPTVTYQAQHTSIETLPDSVRNPTDT